MTNQDDVLENIDDLYTEDDSQSNDSANDAVDNPPVTTNDTPPSTSSSDSTEGNTSTGSASAGDSADASTSAEVPDDRPGIERYLAEFGIEGGMIHFEDGEAVHINDLSPEEQHIVLSSLASEARPTIEQQNDLTEEEVGLLNLVRESGKPVAEVIADMANEQLERIRLLEESQQVDWDQMGDDAVYLAFLKAKSPDLSDEELEEDLNKARETKTYESVVKGIRDDFKTSQEYARQQHTNNLHQKFNQEIENDRKVIVENVSPINEIAGFEINDDIKNDLLSDMLEVNENGDSLLLEQIFSSPQDILEAAWFRKYGKDSINQMENYWKQEASKAYARGRNEALGKLPASDTPARISGIARKNQDTPSDNYGSKPDATTIDDLYND